MFVVNFWNFAKKINSTEQPTLPGSDIQCDLKEDTTITTPILKIAAGVARPLYNYAYIAEFGRYYWIVDWEWIGGLWYCFLRCDVLATYKSSIGSTTCYVARSSAASDGRVQDNAYPTVAEIRTVTDAGSYFDWDLNDGTYVISILGGSGKYYGFDAQNVARFFSYLFSEDYLQQVVGPSIDLDLYPELRVELNALQYIGTVMYLPTQISGDYVTDIAVGRGSVQNVDGIFISDYVQTRGTSIPGLPTHPQLSRGDYLRLPPYTRHVLSFPPYGVFDLPSESYLSGGNLLATITFDVRTGDSVLNVGTSTGGLDAGQTLIRACAPIGVDVRQSRGVSRGYSVTRGAITQGGAALGLAANVAGAGGALANNGVMGTAGSSRLAPGFAAMQGISAGAMAGGAIAATMANIASFVDGHLSHIGEVASSRIPFISSIGASGSACELVGDVQTESFFTLIADEHNASMGRPLCKAMTIANIPGFILCQTAPVEIVGATDTEIGAVKQYMTGGFYYE